MEQSLQTRCTQPLSGSHSCSIWPTENLKKIELAANLEKEPKDFYIKVWLANFSLKVRFDGTCPAFSQAMPGWSRGAAVSFREVQPAIPGTRMEPDPRDLRAGPSRLPNLARPLEYFLSYLET